jgi:hypothetical protein
MATLTHRGITYTTSGSATLTMDLDLPLPAGVDQDDTTWLTAYPGALTSFAARQADGANLMQPRLLSLRLGSLAAAETLTLSGASDSESVTVILGYAWTPASANDSGITRTGDLVLTHDSSATESGHMLLIVA